MTNKTTNKTNINTPPLGGGGPSARFIDSIIIHCAATPEGKAFTAKDIDRWHRERGWRCIGYHYVVLLDGTVERGRAESEVGAHCKGHNAHSIGVCYIGGTVPSTSPKGERIYVPKDTRTPAQKAALINLIKNLKSRYPHATVHSHSDYANKACPVFDAGREYDSL